MSHSIYKSWDILFFNKNNIPNKFPLRLWSWLRLRLQLCGHLFAHFLNNKVDFPSCLVKNIDLIHMLDPIQYELWLNNTTLVWPRSGSQSRNFIYRLQLRLRQKVLAPCVSRSGSGSITLLQGEPPWLQGEPPQLHREPPWLQCKPLQLYGASSALGWAFLAPGCASIALGWASNAPRFGQNGSKVSFRGSRVSLYCSMVSLHGSRG